MKAPGNRLVFVVGDVVGEIPEKISPYLLPNLCANLPAGKAGMALKFSGPIFSPQGACASGNYAVGLGVRMIRDGDCDFVLAGGVDTCIIPEIVHGFENMNAIIKILPGYGDPVGPLGSPFPRLQVLDNLSTPER